MSSKAWLSDCSTMENFLILKNRMQRDATRHNSVSSSFQGQSGRTISANSQSILLNSQTCSEGITKTQQCTEGSLGFM